MYNTTHSDKYGCTVHSRRGGQLKAKTLKIIYIATESVVRQQKLPRKVATHLKDQGRQGFGS